MPTHLLRFFASFLLLGLTASASAQWQAGWLEDRGRRQGPGFRVGNLELHPGLGVEAGYDSNVFLRDGDEPRVDSMIFRISPHFDISTITQQRQEEALDDTPPKIQFNAGISASAYIFLANQARNNVALNGDIELKVLPKRPFGFRLFNNYQRRVRPFSSDSRALTGGRQNHANNLNTSGIDFNFQSDGGVLSGMVGYAFGVQIFESNDFQFGDTFSHRVSANTHWRFLPNTSLFYDFGLTFTDYRNTGTLATSNNIRLRTRVGLNGVFTPKLSALVAVGYGSVFVDNPALEEFDTVIAQAELRFRLTPTTKLTIGYERDFLGSVLGNYRTRDRGYLEFQWLLGKSFLLGLNTWVGYLKFGDITDSTGAPISPDGINRTDVFVYASLFAEYRFTDWLGLNLTVGYTGDFTDFEFTAAPAGVDPADFSKFEAWLGLRVFY